jgi:hypothetical protein
MRPVRVLATLDGVTYPVFYGWVDIQNGWVRIETEAGFATVLVPCNDGFEILNNGRVFTRTLSSTTSTPSSPPARRSTGGSTRRQARDDRGGLLGQRPHRDLRHRDDNAAALRPINDGPSRRYSTTRERLGDANAYQPFARAARHGDGLGEADGDHERRPPVRDPGRRPSLCLSAGSKNVTWQPQAPPRATWAAAWPGSGTLGALGVDLQRRDPSR